MYHFFWDGIFSNFHRQNLLGKCLMQIREEFKEI